MSNMFVGSAKRYMYIITMHTLSIRVLFSIHVHVYTVRVCSSGSEHTTDIPTFSGKNQNTHINVCSTGK